MFIRSTALVVGGALLQLGTFFIVRVRVKRRAYQHSNDAETRPQSSRVISRRINE